MGRRYILLCFLGVMAGLTFSAIAQERNCYGMRWEVLNWNKLAIEFYRSLGATLQTEWFPVLLHGEAFEEFAAGK